MTTVLISTLLLLLATPSENPGPSPLALEWKDNLLTVSGAHLPGKSLTIWYLEAYCRDGSTARNWHDTVIPHRTTLVERSADGSRLVLECRLDDGVVVRHAISTGADHVDFQVEAHNPTGKESAAHWAQPCLRVDRFVGVPPIRNSEEYLDKAFIFLPASRGGAPARTFLKDVKPWAKAARYVPGQVWAAPGVPRNDVNPRPLNPLTPARGLIGCVSADGKKLLAMAWEPYQELFQGVIVCLHADFRIGGLAPAETRRIRGKLYILENDPDLLIKRYSEDFPDSSRTRPDPEP